MSERRWTDRIVGERMTVDSRFASQVADSRFSSQEWNLIMTATEFEIEHAEDPDEARLVANTEQLEHVLPELENVRRQVGAMGATGGATDTAKSSNGIVGAVKGLIGLGDSGRSYAAERQAAERLTAAYADALQSELESNGRWDEVRTAATGDESGQSPE